MQKLSVAVLAACSLLAGARRATADVKLNALFADSMVLQREQPAAIWGTASAGEKVTIHFRDASAEAVAGADGKWKAAIPTGAAGGPFELAVEGKNKLTVKDVLVGEVWLCSGQSNMAFVVAHAKDSAKEIAAANHPLIRAFGVARTPADDPPESVAGKWKVCAPDTVGTFSAAAYFFARDLQPEIGVPIGLIESDVGGTPIEAWMSRAALASDPARKKIVDDYLSHPLATAEEEAAFKKANEDFQAARMAAGRAKLPPPTTAPAAPKGKRTAGEPRVTRLFNGMIAPLAPYTIRGALWYQGEANAGAWTAYQQLLPAMITDWRKTFGQDFTFLVVQLPNHGPRGGKDNMVWARMREAQANAVAAVPKAGIAVTIDTSGDGDLHPPEKQPVGHRLALLAEATVYGKDVVYQGPTFDSMKIDGGKVSVTFKNIAGGLVAKGDTLTGFAVAGEDHKFLPAEASIDGDTVTVQNAKVPQPAAVRYCWANNPIAGLFNKSDLPAAPFRTDNWDEPLPDAKK